MFWSLQPADPVHVEAVEVERLLLERERPFFGVDLFVVDKQSQCGSGYFRRIAAGAVALASRCSRCGRLAVVG